MPSFPVKRLHHHEKKWRRYQLFTRHRRTRDRRARQLSTKLSLRTGCRTDSRRDSRTLRSQTTEQSSDGPLVSFDDGFRTDCVLPSFRLDVTLAADIHSLRQPRRLFHSSTGFVHLQWSTQQDGYLTILRSIGTKRSVQQVIFIT